MKDGKCPKCGSTEVYISDNPFHDTFAVRTQSGSDLFSVQCYLCLECHNMELYASEKSSGLFGKSKSLVNEVPKSSNWKKVA
jgi:hypothetical protein